MRGVVALVAVMAAPAGAIPVPSPTPSCRACPGIHRAAHVTAAAPAEPWMPGRARHDGDGRDVTIARDAFGIAHIHGRTDADAVFGMIYAQAEDDFPRIERNYLAALGRLAEVEGEAAVWTDLRQRLFVDPAALQRSYAQSPPWLRALMNAWAAGLNRYLATHPAVHPRSITRFEPWMALAFSEGSIGGDIERGVDLGALAAFYGGAAPAAPALAPKLADAGRLVEPKGSNGLAFGPTRSASGHPLLWINPHTSFFFRAEQQVQSDQGLDVYGAATWGQFFVYQGFNRRLGWMHTSSGVDNIDEFAVEVAKRNGQLRYRYGRAWRPVRTQAVTLSVRQADGSQALRRFTTLATHHGPIIRAENGRWIAVAMLNAPLAALEQSWLRTRATTLAAYLKVGERKANSSNNTILAAADGTIAYLHPQFVPVRDDRFDYTKPVDGSDPATDWHGLHRLADLPQVVNPASGWVMNTNNAPWAAAGAGTLKPGDFPRYMDQFGENPRGQHALMLFANATRFTPQTLTRAAFDSFLPLFAEQLPGLARGVAADPRQAALAEPLRLLTGWDRRWATGSEATSLAVYWGEALWASEGPRAQAANVPLFTYMATRTTDAARVDALASAVAQMRRDHGTWRIAWGRINRFQRLSGAIAPQFDDRAPSLPVGFTSGNFGSLAAFGVERQAGQRCFYGTSGNSFVAVVEFDPAGPRAWAVSAGGESGDPASPHFDDQARRYTTGDLRPILLDARGLTTYRPGDPRPAEPTRVAAGGSVCGEP
ncbi:penicillin acylase family protein [Sphingomonas sp. KR1UV-12]|uniref:Penicillin acylase family protein n=1 Tax=Sphingomonas aurea TaxID=3063994 RepID=A0ABT9EP77_9SPHN|nr:penicillin acylase family protein [Sphingomonas sp. KR1UV-12]MDP1028770.1 penicillin acylase family protein [Sphingomonas sp. KR1UV-12]